MFVAQQAAAVVAVNQDHRALDLFGTLHEMEDRVLTGFPARSRAFPPPLEALP